VSFAEQNLTKKNHKNDSYITRQESERSVSYLDGGLCMEFEENDEKRNKNVNRFFSFFVFRLFPLFPPKSNDMYVD
jgi:hypothetical protein